MSRLVLIKYKGFPFFAEVSVVARNYLYLTLLSTEPSVGGIGGTIDSFAVR